MLKQQHFQTDDSEYEKQCNDHYQQTGPVFLLPNQPVTVTNLNYESISIWFSSKSAVFFFTWTHYQVLGLLTVRIILKFSLLNNSITMKTLIRSPYMLISFKERKLECFAEKILKNLIHYICTSLY